MLNAREPKIINGPQILDKYVGESEANVRRLFAEAEEEEKRVTLHLVEFNSYCVKNESWSRKYKIQGQIFGLWQMAKLH